MGQTPTVLANEVRNIIAQEQDSQCSFLAFVPRLG
jgi:hypothetical protein